MNNAEIDYLAHLKMRDPLFQLVLVNHGAYY